LATPAPVEAVGHGTGIGRRSRASGTGLVLPLPPVTGEPTVVRVVLGDDQPDVLAALGELVVDSGLELVGAARTGAELIQLCGRLRPDVAVVDVNMPDGGAHALHALRAVAPQTAVVIHSAYDDERQVGRLREAGARGYVVKGCSAEELVVAIRRAAATSPPASG
jgi:DNA-binding NarL/FixJ family response regulator